MKTNKKAFDGGRVPNPMAREHAIDMVCRLVRCRLEESSSRAILAELKREAAHLERSIEAETTAHARGGDA